MSDPNTFFRRADFETVIDAEIAKLEEAMEINRANIASDVGPDRAAYLGHEITLINANLGALRVLKRRMAYCAHFTLTATRLGPDAILRDGNGQTVTLK